MAYDYYVFCEKCQTKEILISFKVYGVDKSLSGYGLAFITDHIVSCGATNLRIAGEQDEKLEGVEHAKSTHRL